MRQKDRHISILDYYTILQLEYLLYELRSKIYPASEDKAKFKQILLFKKEKIDDIARKNHLDSMFDSKEYKEELYEKLFDGQSTPKEFNGRDKYFYYFIGSDFSFDGQGFKLKSYNLKEDLANLESNGKKVSASLLDIRRIF